MSAERKGLLDLHLDDSTGEFEAVIATMGVVDKHGDVLEPGFAGEQEVRIVWGHEWTEPIGKGRVYEDGDKLIAEGRFFLNVDSAREKYELVKEMGDLQEWSWGFFIQDGATSKDGDGRRIIKALPDGRPGVDIFEVSPVLVGAGVGTQTLALKASDPDDGPVGDTQVGTMQVPIYAGTPTYGDTGTYYVGSGGSGSAPYPLTNSAPAAKRLRDEIDDAALVLEAAIERLSEVVTLRAEKGRTIGTDTTQAATRLALAIHLADERLDELLHAEEYVEADAPTTDPDLEAQWRALYAAQLRQHFADTGVY